ncbi:hypothetical protein Kpol_529p12 [Vanderwaltozyma polyspora DSM 70294]|uniref:BRCT domain-containing protein n=1 Tax=Vanderwaltozyma polyspora (strain ATCC 22028 / DSM 70294 / BCRC 21397 / CBS 2163 / NBRC 10782 / NRRL Y-8283 / UCD 57-17) TaxID=436907 RepID=A7TM65_VANPO|nr:uncharacterized protein Kpol_529p12 [Vanderwaltozyma polyspora DSM 70294]EDO16632.1 hypothetical protein Kpol_529p12 [Vanderwaltozyma polyspora DSM 70294]
MNNGSDDMRATDRDSKHLFGDNEERIELKNVTPSNRDDSVVKNPIKSMSTEDIFVKNNVPKPSVKSNNHSNTTPSPNKYTRSSNNSPLGKRTQDINRIAMFFKDGHSPIKYKKNNEKSMGSMEPEIQNDNSKLSKLKVASGSEIAERLNYSSDDTPPSQRNNNLAKINVQNDINPKNIINKLRLDQINNNSLRSFQFEQGGIQLNYEEEEEGQKQEQEEKQNDDKIVSTIKDQVINPSRNTGITQPVCNSDIDITRAIKNLYQTEFLSSEYSVIDDTTEANIPHKIENTSIEMNGYKSTQLIDTSETHTIKLLEPELEAKEQIFNTEQPKSDHKKDYRSNLLNGETQPIISSDQNAISTQVDLTQISDTSTIPLFLQRRPSFSESNQPDNNINTPVPIKKNEQQTILEVPQTKSPIFNEEKNGVKNTDSSPTPRDRDQNWISNSFYESASPDKIYLQISSNIDLTSSQNGDLVKGAKDCEEKVIFSEAEMTQELPEVEEQNEDELKNKSDNALVSDLNESQDIVPNGRMTKRRKMTKLQEINLDKSLENFSNKEGGAPGDSNIESTRIDSSNINLISNEATGIEDSESTNIKFQYQESSPQILKKTKKIYPSGILSEDKNSLSNDDILFENSVWCLYSLNCQFYPGILLNAEPNTSKSWIMFENEKNLMNNDDIYYLNIMIGDRILWKGHPYTIVGLECNSHEESIIRCVRGYDTLHLKKKTASGTLGKKTYITPLSSISMDINEWTKRSQLITNSEEKDDTESRKISTPLRSHRSQLGSSPLKSLMSSPIRSASKTHLTTSDSTTKTFSKKSIFNEATDSILSYNYDNPKSLIFKHSIFILTNVSENRDELSELILANGGTILELGFSSLFNYSTSNNSVDESYKEFDLSLKFKEESLIKDFRFACLIADNYSRSLKYLETLALQWPVLHWKFVVECVTKQKLVLESVFKYLLPAGESLRFALQSDTSKACTVKSSNIFNFYTKLIRNEKLPDQINGLTSLLSDAIVILNGSTDLDDFIKFLFASTGVKTLYQLKEFKTNGIIQSIQKILDSFGKLPKLIIVYMNVTKNSSQYIPENIRDEINNSYEGTTKFYFKSKEWLIQTLINEDTSLG